MNIAGHCKECGKSLSKKGLRRHERLERCHENKKTQRGTRGTQGAQPQYLPGDIVPGTYGQLKTARREAAR